MRIYHIDEIQDDMRVASYVASGATPLAALEKIIGKPVSPRALQQHWFRVRDESDRSVFEYSFTEEQDAKTVG